MPEPAQRWIDAVEPKADRGCVVEDFAAQRVAGVGKSVALALAHSGRYGRFRRG